MDACFIADVEPWLTFLILWYCRLTRVHLPLAGMIPGNYVSMLTDWSLPLRTRIRNFLNYHLSRWIPGRMHVVGTSRQILETLGMADSPYARVVPEGHENLIGKRSQVSARSALGIPMGTRMLLLFGVASKAKGADLLFRAMEYVPPDFLVYVVGETGGVYLPSWGDVETLQQRGWSGKLKVISHFVSEDMMQDLYAACDAVVIPYRHGFAGTSTSLRRASEYGKVILACDQHHIGARVRERNLGLTFQTEDAMSLAATLREFVRQPEQWFKEVAERSRQLLQDESWEQVGLMYRDMFESIWAAKKYSCRETGRRM
jgi:glycosyltransferase involved in cell wall biosynthesis